MKKKTIFDFAVLGYTNVGTTDNSSYETELIIRDTVLAIDAHDAQFQIFRLIPESAVIKFGSENLTIVIRPF